MNSKTLAEQHEKPSSEEDDQKDRSTKKGKDRCPEALVVQHSVTVAGNSSTVAGTSPTVVVTGSAGSDGMVDTALTSSAQEGNVKTPASSVVTETSDFGPWMIVQRPQRRKNHAQKEGGIAGKGGSGSNRFIALQRDVDVTNVVHEAACEKRESIPSKVTRAQVAKRPKQLSTKKTNTQPIKTNKSTATGKSDKPLALDVVGPYDVSTTEKEGIDIAKLQEARSIRKEKEDTILRIMSQKQNLAWKQYLNDKLIMEDLLYQHVHQRSEEELAQIHRLLESEKWKVCASVGESSKPPDIVPDGAGNAVMIDEHEGSQLDSNGAQSHACA
ncbi:hypothetical protein RIF29_17080 [Crotalaria pallida]|uniref:Uncharacterized protein n=1 Tax=Crotalaria pallida TaxID=3830 RepID=A0AAN9FNH3_CROPI